MESKYARGDIYKTSVSPSVQWREVGAPVLPIFQGSCDWGSCGTMGMSVPGKDSTLSGWHQQQTGGGAPQSHGRAMPYKHWSSFLSAVPTHLHALELKIHPLSTAFLACPLAFPDSSQDPDLSPGSTGNLCRAGLAQFL